MPSPREEGYTGGKRSVKATQKIFSWGRSPVISASGRKIFLGPDLDRPGPPVV